jgi:integrase
MSRRRTERVSLPRGVETKLVKGKAYRYWNPHRGTEREVERIRLPNDINSEAFWRELNRVMSVQITFPNRSIGDLIDRYRKSEEFKRLSESTQTSYNIHLKRFAKTEAWGMYSVDDLEPIAVVVARDSLKDTPGMANQMLAVGRALYSWALPLGLCKSNPFVPVKPLPVLDKGHVPWPGWVVDYVVEHAPPDLVRMVRLGIITCQRESDLVRMGPQHREKSGIWCRPTKTKRKRRSVHIPLTMKEAAEIDRFGETPIEFTAIRWKAPIERYREDLYLYSPKGAAYNPDSLRARWNRWLQRSADGMRLCTLWQSWVGDQIQKYEWDIEVEDTMHPTIHGLRGTGLLARRNSGFEIDDIADQVGMSRQMVERYMRFKDQLETGAGRHFRVVTSRLDRNV